MSDDLISRKALLNTIVRNCRLKTENSEEYGFIDILSDISDFPISYDVDKVMEEMKKTAEYAEMKVREFPGLGYWKERALAYRRSVEIVKRGYVEHEEGRK